MVSPRCDHGFAARLLVAEKHILFSRAERDPRSGSM